MSVAYVSLSVNAVKFPVGFPPAKYPFVESPSHPANPHLAWLRFAVV